MARSLEDRWFHTNYNNGVTAVVSHEIWENMRKKNTIMLALENVGKGNGGQEDILPHIPETPIFTFASADRVARSPWLTGTCSSQDRENDLYRLLNYITRNGGGFSDASFRVPFSNGNEVGLHGPEGQREELKYVTTSAQFEETFGISLRDLRESGDKYL